ncbi:hypothetical protein BJ508DRAFT_234232 [Ascobolus immersus RN42]|uniref:Integral membrane protein n=1 Tax=Ascobolus immersus RN42 TaxID=1160509 RepID=A0A3N4ILA4_ASCIM|nr:hypothetical protein BJ508DRAFT_234232 [Ascobolus immersus RN42]
MGTQSAAHCDLANQVRIALTPATKAYAIGLVSSVSPRLFQLVRSRARRARRARKARQNGTSGSDSDGSRHRELKPLSEELLVVLKKSLEPHRFPTFCAVSIGGWSFLLPVIRYLLTNPVTKSRLSSGERRVLASFLAASLSGAAGLSLLNSGPVSHHSSSTSSTGGGVSRSGKDVIRDIQVPLAEEGKPMAGRTMDLTLFAVTRAVDVVVTLLWEKWRARRKQSGGWSWIERRIEGGTVPAVFAVSSGVVMYAWFYTPSKLPKTYNKWITDISETDARLIEALRRIRSGKFIYGHDTGEAALLGTYCEDLGLPAELGDPAKTAPIPCIIVHEGHNVSCEVNALRRSFKGFKFAFQMYLALNLLSKLRNPSKRALWLALKDSIQASSFLGAFIGLFWYGVCLTRTRLGPQLMSQAPVGFFDNEIIVRVGCMLCGWSIYLEEARRRAEMAFFVAPRALAVVLPRKYDVTKRWREVLAFALSAGVIVTAAREERRLLRGVFGRLLSSITGRRETGSRARSVMWPFGGR